MSRSFETSHTTYVKLSLDGDGLRDRTVDWFRMLIHFRSFQIYIWR